MNRAHCLLVVLGLLAPLYPGHGKDKPQPKGNALMQRKLQHSQKLLEALTLNNFKGIETHASELVDVSKQAGWRALKTPMYEVYSNDFRRSAAEVAKKGKEKNLDGAALAYVEMTLTCIKCHKHVREVRMTSLPRTDPLLLPDARVPDAEE